MKSIHRFGLGAVFTVASAAVWLACSNDDTSGSSAMDASTTADVTTTTPDSGSETPDSATAAPDTGTEAVDTGTGAETSTQTEAGVLSCTTYCAAVMSACTGAYQQYLDVDECMTACAHLPLGTAGDTSGNTVGCRATHAGYASATPNPHCWHAGPFGYGACGAECDSFCLLATSFCSADGGYDGGPPPYASMGACSTACAGFPRIDDVDGGGPLGVDGGYNAAGPQSGNTLDCREWHLDNALDKPGSSAGQNLHCAHIGATSVTCVP